MQKIKTLSSHLTSRIVYTILVIITENILVEDIDESLTITIKRDPYIVIETLKPMLPTRSFRWWLSWNGKADIATIIKNTSKNGIVVMATFTCNNIFTHLKNHVSYNLYSIIWIQEPKKQGAKCANIFNTRRE